MKMGRAIESDVKMAVLLSNAEEVIRKQLQQEADREQETFDALAKRIDIFLQLPSFHSRPGPYRERQRIARFSADTADFVECMERNSYTADRNSTQNIIEGDQCSHADERDATAAKNRFSACAASSTNRTLQLLR